MFRYIRTNNYLFRLSMSQVSKRTVKKEVNEQLTRFFDEAISYSFKRRGTLNFIDSLLTTTERKMLRKRFGIACMLAQGYDYSLIGSILKVSKQTVWSIKKDIENNEEYTLVAKAVGKENKNRKFWESLDIVLTELMPPRPGTDWRERRRKLFRRKKKLIEQI